MHQAKYYNSSLNNNYRCIEKAVWVLFFAYACVIKHYNAHSLRGLSTHG